MLILWILLGVVMGLIVARVWLGKKHRLAMADLEGSWYDKVRRAEEAAAKAKAELDALKAGGGPKPAALRAAAKLGQARTSGAAAPGQAPSESSDLDDLTQISGVGPVLKDKLYKLGITTFQQIAELTPEDVARVDEMLDFPGRVEREDWIGQARKMVEGERHHA